MEIVDGSIFDSKEKYLCHQTNCVTTRAAHLSKTVFEYYPYADIYTKRQEPDKPGTIVVKGDGDSHRFIVNMLGQYYPGSPRYPDGKGDGTLAREEYFHKCLIALSKIPNLESVAFPYRIGCGAAGGNWEKYQTMISNFSAYVAKTQNAKVVVYRVADNAAK